MKARLTRAEINILELIAEGFDNKKIAEIEDISDKTVAVHIKNIYKKLKLPKGNSRVLATIYYLKYFA